jgi:KaiC/GvpD/RAD55 family RecA-like ATPase
VTKEEEELEAQRVEHVAVEAALEAERIAYEEDIRRLEAEAKNAERRELTSWAPVDLGAILDGGVEPPQPTILARRDGRRLLYPGRTHSFVGESEHGKTLGAYLACSQELLDGNGVVVVDFEGEPEDFVRWMVNLGVPTDVIRAKARYVRPDTAIDDVGKLAIREACMEIKPTLVVFDGVTEAMMLHDLNDNATTDTARFMQMLPKKFERVGVTVLLIDHTPHGGNRATGSQHKRASVTGSSFLFIRRAPLVEGKHGAVDITVLKDRPSQVRKHSDKGKRAGVLRVQPGDGSLVEMWIESATPQGFGEVGPEVLERVSRFVEENEDASRKTIREGCSGDNDANGEALDVLVRDGYLRCREREHGSSTWRNYTSLIPFRVEENGSS